MVASWFVGCTHEETGNKSKGREPHLAQLIDFNRSWLCCSYCMKLKSLQMLWAITLPFKGAYDMLATFNEILFKMPSADSEIPCWNSTLKNGLRKFVLCQAVSVMCGSHLGAKSSFSAVGGDLQASGSVSAMMKRVFSSLGRGYKDSMFVFAVRVRSQSSLPLIHWRVWKLQSFLLDSVYICWRSKTF